MPGSPDDHDPTHPAILPEHHPPPLPGHYQSLSHASALTPKNLFEYHVLSGDHERDLLLCSKPKLLGGGMSPTALTWAFASSVAKSSGYIADQRKRDHGIWSWSRIFCTEKPCPGQCSRRSG